MKDVDSRVVGNFDTADRVVAAIKSLKEAGLGSVTAYSPVNDGEIEGAIGRAASHVGWFSLIGALAGAAAGLLLTVGTSLQQPIMTGGQPILSLPPFMVITFELTILFGVLATMLGMIWSIYRGKGAPASYDDRFSSDRIGLVIYCGAEKVEWARSLLLEAGAKEIGDEKF